VIHPLHIWITIATFSLALTTSARAATQIALDMRDLDIYDAVRLLATQASVNLVLDASVPHRPVSLQLKALRFDEALAAFARLNDLVAVRVGNVVYLGPPETIHRRYPSSEASENRTRTFTLRNALPDPVGKTLGDLLPRGTLVIADRRTSELIVTGTPASLARAAALLEALDRPTDLASETVALRYLRAADALRAVQATIAVAPPAGIYAAEQQNALLVTGSSDFIARVRESVARIDRPAQQVRYDVRVTDISPSDASNVGLIFGGLSLAGQPVPGQATTAFVGNSVALNATINALVSKGEASILAQPTLTTINNVQASLLVGQQFPLVYFDARTGTQQVQFANIGVNLVVLPNIGADGAITTELETDYSTVVNFVNGFPIIGTRKAQSTLRVHDGETIVIAGLFQELDARTLTKVPILGDVPLLGEIFKNRLRSHVKDEVVFLITPRLVRDQEAPKS
jgi:type II secretory pathway component GspD/PulD (secretin)